MPSARAMEEMKDVGPDVPIRLDVAAALAFPDGTICASSLRREAARGRLTVWRVANKDMTTLNEIRSMMDRCRVKSCQPDCGSGQPSTGETPSTSSSTVDVKSALAAARMRTKRLRESSPNTSVRSTTPPHGPNVVPIKRP